MKLVCTCLIHTRISRVLRRNDRLRSYLLVKSLLDLYLSLTSTCIVSPLVPGRVRLRLGLGNPRRECFGVRMSIFLPTYLLGCHGLPLYFGCKGLYCPTNGCILRIRTFWLKKEASICETKFTNR